MSKLIQQAKIDGNYAKVSLVRHAANRYTLVNYVSSINSSVSRFNTYSEAYDEFYKQIGRYAWCGFKVTKHWEA